MKLNLVKTAIILFLMSLPAASYAQAPTLGSAAGFVIFSSTGAVGNTGTTSQFTGNIGTKSGAITIGVNVNSILHTADSVSIAVAANVVSAYQQLQLTPPTDTQFGGPSYTLGNHDTLHAIVDSITVNTLLSDTLVLDAQNNANAVFIFKINGTFSSSANAAIVLINGAVACNVFWQVNGAATTAANTTLRGTFITNSSLISLGAGTTLEGRALTSTAGAVTGNSVLAYLPTGCGSPVLSGPAAPALGSTACYALFTSNGANANSGITYVTGDVGTNVGLTTGYDSLLVTGTIHKVHDTSTSVCASDLLTVYTYLNTLTTDIQLLYPAQFGNNLVLTPHTYLLSAATMLTDTLYLNAAGNANAVFVIKINGDLTTSTYATVVLRNGAQAKNVFWKVDGATTINNYSVFKGTIVGNNGAINLNTGVHLEGRALTTTGAFSAAADSATIPALTCSAMALPLHLLYFRGEAVQESVSLGWSTANEVNNAFFTIEKSGDAVRFDLLATVAAASKESGDKHNYSVTDAHPYGLTYYRIAQTDNSGRKTYFNTIQVKTNAGYGTNGMAYVQGNFIMVTHADASAGNGRLVLYSIEGKRIATQPILLTTELNTYKIERPAHNGLYILYLENQGVKQYAGKVMVD